MRRLPVVVSVVAKSNTGKTRLLEGLIPALGDIGIRVGVIKHHSHPGTFDTPGKDTHRIASAGAEVVVGLGPDEVAVFTRPTRPVDIDDAVRRHLVDMDIVFTEGYKRGPYPKVEINRMARSDELLCDPSELIALVTDGNWDIGVPTFDLDDFSALARMLVEKFALLDWDRGAELSRGEIRGLGRHPRTTRGRPGEELPARYAG